MPQPWQEALGDFIRSQRKLANLSLRDMAERTNVSNPYLSQLERGLHEPSVRVLKSIAQALNLSAETLLAQAGVLEDVVGERTDEQSRDRGGHQGRQPDSPTRRSRRCSRYIAATSRRTASRTTAAGAAVSETV